MATRTSSVYALILRAKDGPSGDRIVTLLSAEEGLVDAFAFGGAKSKLRSLASPWHEGRAWLYRDPGKGLTKLTDFDVELDHASIRSALPALGAASLASELAIATEGFGGDWAGGLALCRSLLSALDEAVARDGAATGDEARMRAAADGALAGFCLRAAAMAGLLPDPADCSLCAGQSPADGLCWYSRRAGAFVCGRCAAAEPEPGDLVELPAGAARWLALAASPDEPISRRAGLGRAELSALRAIGLDLAAKVAHGRLKTLESGLL